MRAPQVIIVWHHSITGRPEINGAPVWVWSGCDRGRDLGDTPTVCGGAVDGDYIVWHDTYCADGKTVRARPWSVVKARARGSDRRGGTRVEVGVVTINPRRRIEDAIHAARVMLREDARQRGDVAGGEPTVFVIDPVRGDINCGHLTGEPSPAVRTVKFKHRGRAVEVPTMLCHGTLDAAKAAMVQRLRERIESINALEFDPDNFWVV